MSQLETTQRQTLLLLKELVDQALVSNTTDHIEEIQTLSSQLRSQRIPQRISQRAREQSLAVQSPSGLAILQNNVFFRDLIALVQSEEFQTFYNRHMNRSIDHKPALVYLELHQVLQQIHMAEYGTPMPPETGALVLKTIISEQMLRAPLIPLILSYLDGKTNKTNTYQSVKRILAATHQQFLVDKEM